MVYRADSRFAPSQWEMSLQSNAVSHWLGANLESAQVYVWYSNYSGFRFQVFIFNKYIGTIYIYGSINTKHEKQIKEILNKKEQKQ